MGDWLMGIGRVVDGTIDPILRFFQVMVAKLFFKNSDDKKKNDEKKICRGFRPSPHPEELSQAMWNKLVGHALEDYRQKQGVVLNLHGEVAAIHTWSMSRKVWAFHFHFQATSQDNDDSPKTMFAEVFWYSLGKSFLVNFAALWIPLILIWGRTAPSVGKHCSIPRGVELKLEQVFFRSILGFHLYFPSHSKTIYPIICVLKFAGSRKELPTQSCCLCLGSVNIYY